MNIKASGKEILILVVDDDPSVLETFKLIGELFPAAQIDTAISATQAQALVSARSYDLVIIDIVMPDMDGFELCQLFKHHPHTSHAS